MWVSGFWGLVVGLEDLFFKALYVLVLNISFASYDSSSSSDGGGSRNSGIRLPRGHICVLGRNSCRGGGTNVACCSPSGEGGMVSSVFCGRGRTGLKSAKRSVVGCGGGVCMSVCNSGCMYGLGRTYMRRTHCDFASRRKRPHCVTTRSKGLCIALDDNGMTHLSTGALAFRGVMTMKRGPRRVVRRSNGLCLMGSNFKCSGHLSVVSVGAFSATRRIRVFRGPSEVLRTGSGVFVRKCNNPCPSCSCAMTVCSGRGGACGGVKPNALVTRCGSIMCIVCSRASCGAGASGRALCSCGTGAGGGRRADFLRVPRRLGAHVFCVLDVGPRGKSFCINAASCGAGKSVCHFGGSNAFVRGFRDNNMDPETTMFVSWPVGRFSLFVRLVLSILLFSSYNKGDGATSMVRTRGTVPLHCTRGLDLSTARSCAVTHLHGP